MLPEALVIFACVKNTGCSETSSLYFSQNPEVKREIDLKAEHLRNYVGPSVVDTIGPMLFVVAGGTGTVKINKYFSFQFNKESGILSFRCDLP